MGSLSQGRGSEKVCLFGSLKFYICGRRSVAQRVCWSRRERLEQQLEDRGEVDEEVEGVHPGLVLVQHVLPQYARLRVEQLKRLTARPSVPLGQAVREDRRARRGWQARSASRR